METLRRSLEHQREPFPSDSKKLRGAVAVLLKEEADDLLLLMIRRRESARDPWSGQMAFPGGHAEPEDHSLFDTAARETLEEVGIDVCNQTFLGCLRNVETKNAPMIVAPFVFLLSGEVYPRVGPEADEIVWIRISFFLDRGNLSSIMVTVGSEKIPMGCYKYSNHTIWGMSFRIIREIVAKITSDRRSEDQ